MNLQNFLLFLTLFCLLTPASAQNPSQAISYQTVVRNVDGSLVANQAIAIQFLIHQTTATGTVPYSEIHTDTTNEFGLLNLEIGLGTPVIGTFSAIDWSAGPYFTEIQIDPSGGSSYTSIGAQQMLSVPFALYAGSAPEDSTNELQMISISNDTIVLSNGGFAVLPVNPDPDPVNELQTLTLSGDTLYISAGNYVVLSGLSPTATCSDSIQNGDETGVDCGGSQCQSCSDLCTDGVQYRR